MFGTLYPKSSPLYLLSVIVCVKSHNIVGMCSPDLFCTPEELAHLLLDGGRGHVAERDRGVKIVHLVRNPFVMAVSNYHYHAQIPT